MVDLAKKDEYIRANEDSLDTRYNTNPTEYGGKTSKGASRYIHEVHGLSKDSFVYVNSSSDCKYKLIIAIKDRIYVREMWRFYFNEIDKAIADIFTEAQIHNASTV